MEEVRRGNVDGLNEEKEERKEETGRKTRNGLQIERRREENKRRVGKIGREVK